MTGSFLLFHGYLFRFFSINYIVLPICFPKLERGFLQPIKLPNEVKGSNLRVLGRAEVPNRRLENVFTILFKIIEGTRHINIFFLLEFVRSDPQNYYYHY